MAVSANRAASRLLGSYEEREDVQVDDELDHDRDPYRTPEQLAEVAPAARPFVDRAPHKDKAASE